MGWLLVRFIHIIHRVVHSIGHFWAFWMCINCFDCLNMTYIATISNIPHARIPLVCMHDRGGSMRRRLHRNRFSDGLSAAIRIRGIALQAVGGKLQSACADARRKGVFARPRAVKQCCRCEREPTVPTDGHIVRRPFRAPVPPSKACPPPVR